MTITKSTMDFLSDLKANNERPWFEANKARFEKAKKEFKGFVKALEEEMNKHDVIEKSKIFRIYRDVRFSNDKTPYKSSMSVGFTRAGAARRGGYYFAISPDEIMIGGGFWAPEPQDLKRIRDEFAFDAQPIRKIMADPTFVKHFGNLEGESVKTAPKGFDKDHENIDLIRMKQYLVYKRFTNKQLYSPSFYKELDEAYQAMRPFFDHFSYILTTNLNGESVI